MSGSSLQFAILNSTTIENLSRKNVVWTLAVYMPKPPEGSPGFRTISVAAPPISPTSRSNTTESTDTIRTFAILHTKPGENPFDLGPFQNFKSVMGNCWHEWILPLAYSPCCDHNRIEGQFAMGPVVQRMRKEAGILAPVETRNVHRKRKRRHHHHKDRSEVERSERASRRHDGGEISFDTSHRHGNGSVHQ